MLYSLNVVDVADCDGREEEAFVKNDVCFNDGRIVEEQFSTRKDLKDEQNQRGDATTHPKQSVCNGRVYMFE